MKQPRQPATPPPSRNQSVWVWVAINQLAFPGLGTLLAGRRVGYLQATSMVAGFLLVLAYFGWFVVGIVHFAQTGDETAWQQHCRQHWWVWQAGLLLSALAWFWALISSIDLLRRPPHRPSRNSPKASGIDAAPPSAP